MVVACVKRVGTLVAVFPAVSSLLRGHVGVERRARAQLGDHLHHVGHYHLTGAHGFEALGQRSVRVLLDVHLGLNGHRPPATRGVDGDFFKLRAIGGI